MKKKRFSEEQITYALAQESTGETIAEICRRLGCRSKLLSLEEKVWSDGIDGDTQTQAT